MTAIRFPSFLTNAYSNVLDLAESVAGSSNLDVMEARIEDHLIKSADRKTLCAGLAASTAFISYLSPYPIATMTIASLGIWVGFAYYDQIEEKKDLIEKKISQIVADSVGNPKKALVIQSVTDENGALSMRTHVDNLRTLAKTHSIERVLVKTEKAFFRSLPPGKFDVVWIRAHGTPTSIELGIDFELNKSSPHKHFYTLASKVNQNGKIILECCNVANNAKSECSVAEHIASYCLDATVYAPISKISGIFGLQFDKWGYPQFNDGSIFRGKPVTRVIESPERTYFTSAPFLSPI